LIGGGIEAPYMSEVVDWQFFPSVLLGTRTTDPKRSNLAYHTSVDAVSANDLSFGDLIDASHPMQELPPKKTLTSVGQ
jgi:hypothetical protein